MYYCVIFVEKSSLKLNELSSGEDIQEWLKEKIRDIFKGN